MTFSSLSGAGFYSLITGSKMSSSRFQPQSFGSILPSFHIHTMIWQKARCEWNFAVDTVGGNFSSFTNDFADDTFLASNVFRRFASDVPAFPPNRETKTWYPESMIVDTSWSTVVTLPHLPLSESQVWSIFETVFLPMPYILDVLSQPVKACNVHLPFPCFCTRPQQVGLCNSLLIDLPLTHIQRLQSVQNAAARLIFNLRRCDRITNTLISDSHLSPTCRTNAGSGPPSLNSLTSDLSSVNCRRSCLSCCWNKGVEWPAKRIAAGIQEQAEDILVPPLLRNWLWMTFPFAIHYLPSRTVVLAIVFTV